MIYMKSLFITWSETILLWISVNEEQGDFINFTFLKTGMWAKNYACIHSCIGGHEDITYVNLVDSNGVRWSPTLDNHLTLPRKKVYFRIFCFQIFINFAFSHRKTIFNSYKHLLTSIIALLTLIVSLSTVEGMVAVLVLMTTTSRIYSYPVFYYIPDSYLCMFSLDILIECT